MARKQRSPWADRAEQQRASARMYNDLSNESGRAFQPLQDEAFESFCEWEERMEAEEE